MTKLCNRSPFRENLKIRNDYFWSMWCKLLPHRSINRSRGCQVINLTKKPKVKHPQGTNRSHGFQVIDTTFCSSITLKQGKSSVMKEMKIFELRKFSSAIRGASNSKLSDGIFITRQIIPCTSDVPFLVKTWNYRELYKKGNKSWCTLEQISIRSSKASTKQLQRRHFLPAWRMNECN